MQATSPASHCCASANVRRTAGRKTRVSTPMKSGGAGSSFSSAVVRSFTHPRGCICTVALWYPAATWMSPCTKSFGSSASSSQSSSQASCASQ